MGQDDARKAGGVIGNKVELIVEDNESDPTAAVATAARLIQMR